MNFSTETLREELSVMLDHEGKLRPGFNVDHAMQLIKKLRDAEYKENGYVTARNGMTGY